MAKHRSELPRGGTTQHIHNHSPNPAISIVAIATVVLIGVLLAWHAGIYLLDLAGARQPRETMAQVVIWGVGLFVFSFLATRWLESVMDRCFAHKQTMANITTEQLRYKQMMIGSAVTDTRALGEDKRLNALVLAVAMEAYDYLAKNNTRYFRGQSRPWSRRQAGAQVLASLGETNPVGEAMAQRARTWLEERGIVTGDDQVDLDRFPNLASVQRLLYGPPVVRSPYLPSSGEEGPEWSIIENA